MTTARRRNIFKDIMATKKTTKKQSAGGGTFLRFIKSRFLWLNLLAAVLAGVMICLGVLWWLKAYTRHGEAIEVPDLTGLYVEEAEILLKERNLSYELIDSVYRRSLRPGEIAEQSPAKGSFVKKNRKIYLIINAKSKRMVRFSDLKGESFRKAQSNYRNSGFVVDSIEYKPAPYADEVLDIRLLADNRQLQDGEMIPEGSSLILVVGKTEEGLEVVIPVFRGATYEQAVAMVGQHGLTLGATSFDKEPADDADRLLYYVYRQEPHAGESVGIGTRVDLWFSKDKNKRYVEKKTDDEEFF